MYRNIPFYHSSGSKQIYGMLGGKLIGESESRPLSKLPLGEHLVRPRAADLVKETQLQHGDYSRWRFVLVTNHCARWWPYRQLWWHLRSHRHDEQAVSEHSENKDEGKKKRVK